MNPSEPDTRPSSARRLLTSLVALAIGAAGVGFVWSAFRSGDVKLGSGAVEVGRISCKDGATIIENPRVNAQPDGLHSFVEADFDEPVVTFFGEGGWQSALGLGPESGRSASFVTPIPPGEVTVQCGPREVDEPARDAPILHLFDPEGIYHSESLVCGDDILEWFPDVIPFYYTAQNPVPEVFYRTLPGLQPEDEISFAGYRDGWGGPGTSFRIVRDSGVVGWFDLSTYDQRTYVMSGVFCASSGIAGTGAEVSGLTSTPFMLPDYAPCDPYSDPCASVFLSAARYEELTGDPPKIVSNSPWAACSKYTSSGCLPEPKEMIVRVVIAQDDAARFENVYRCGASEQTFCV